MNVCSSRAAATSCIQAVWWLPNIPNSFLVKWVLVLPGRRVFPFTGSGMTESSHTELKVGFEAAKLSGL